MPTNLPAITRYLDEKQWLMVSDAMRSAFARPGPGTRLQIDAFIHLMTERLQWVDLDYRYGDYHAIHSNFRRWLQKGVLYDVFRALYETGIAKQWTGKYYAVKAGPSAMPGPSIQVCISEWVHRFLADEAAALARAAKGKAKAGVKGKGMPSRVQSPALPVPKDPALRQGVKAAKARHAEVRRVNKATAKTYLTDAAWGAICQSLPQFEEPGKGWREHVTELHAVMCQNKSWNLMKIKGEAWSAAYSRFAAWMKDGTMVRLVSCMRRLGLTDHWTGFLVAPGIKGEKSLKRLIGTLAHRHVAVEKKAAEAEIKKAAAKRARKAAKVGKTTAGKATAGKTRASRATVAVKNSKRASGATRATATRGKSKGVSARSAGRGRDHSAKPAAKTVTAVAKPRAAKTARASS